MVNRPENEAAPRPLLWNADGAVRCTQHAPYPGSDTWHAESWRRMTDAQIASYAMKSGQPVECESCLPIRPRIQSGALESSEDIARRGSPGFGGVE